MSSQQRNLDQEKHDKWLRSQSTTTLKNVAVNLGTLMREKDASKITQLRSKNDLSPPGKTLDAIERAIQKHPGLTREEAQEIVDAFGF